MALSIILDPTTAGTVKVGHGWYDQQQHILIVVFDTWDLEVNLHEPKVLG